MNTTSSYCTITGAVEPRETFRSVFHDPFSRQQVPLAPDNDTRLLEFQGG